MLRRDERLKAHMNNDTWTKRDKPPERWNSRLPEWMEDRNRGTYLEIKSNELKKQETEEKMKWKERQKNNEIFKESESSFCSIM